MWSAGSLYTGGADTVRARFYHYNQLILNLSHGKTTASLTTFVLAICLHPHVQEKAQKELDTVIGTERLPVMADRENLPYVNACVRELLRLYPVGPLGKSED